jgi:NAD(P)-dependent dehydrogenase (short-subunit alcohol dehydrogenase family)
MKTRCDNPERPSKQHLQSGQTVLVTGASAGIGAASAIALAEKGFRVCLMARRRDRLEGVAGHILELTGRDDAAIVFVGDVTKEDDCRGAVDFATQAWGRLDVLLNSAGSALAGALEDVSLAEARSQLEVNALGPLAMMRSAGPILRQQGYGRIINISSISGIMALPGLGAYSASKYALEAFSDAARREYEPWGVKVILIEPGGIATEIWDTAKADLTDRIERSGDSPFREFYDFQLQQLDELLNGGTPVKVVSDAVVHAATARRPRPRYCMPRQCRLRKLVAQLPTALEDWIVRRYVRMTRPSSDLGHRE